jgi:hypothetical protein
MIAGVSVLPAMAILASVGLLLLVAGTIYQRRVDEEPPADDVEPGHAGTDAFVRRIGAMVGQIGYAVFRLLPFGARFWKRLAERSLYYYHKRSGGDRLALEKRPNGQIELTPVKWRPPETLDELEDRPGWKAKGKDKVWEPVAEGQTGGRIGKTPVVPVDAQSWRDSSWAEASVAEAVDLDRWRPLFNVEAADLRATVDMQGQGGQAVADGGVANVEFDARDSPVFEDAIIDISSPDEYDGKAISWWKVKELYGEKTTTDEMQKQEDRGFLAGRSKENLKSWMLKILLIGGAVAVAGLIGPELISGLLGGGGGGGGGSIMPFTITPPSLGLI